MAGSKKRPLLSGYYHLMEMALQLYSQSGFLKAETQLGQVIDTLGKDQPDPVMHEAVCRYSAVTMHLSPMVL
jgi:hypothetical protein